MDFVNTVNANEEFVPYPTDMNVVPVQMIKADSLGLNVLDAEPSIVLEPEHETVNEPVPLFFNKINQLSPVATAEGKIAVPAPPDHNLVNALSADVKV